MKTGYVLSGGGARGFAHLGVLKLMEELNIKPYAISGTSAGAIIGALYASGHSAESILELMKKTSFFGWSKMNWGKPGIFTLGQLEKVLKKHISTDDFNALNMKLFVAATDLNYGESVLISSGSVISAVLASSSVPAVFEPVMRNEKLLADGGILNNFPIEPLEEICEVIIGSHVNNIIYPVEDDKKLSAIAIMDRSFHISISHTVFTKINHCNIFLDPFLGLYNMFDVKDADEIFRIGYNAAYAQKEIIKQLIPQ